MFDHTIEQLKDKRFWRDMTIYTASVCGAVYVTHSLLRGRKIGSFELISEKLTLKTAIKVCALVPVFFQFCIKLAPPDLGKQLRYGSYCRHLIWARKEMRALAIPASTIIVMEAVSTIFYFVFGITSHLVFELVTGWDQSVLNRTQQGTSQLSEEQLKPWREILLPNLITQGWDGNEKVLVVSYIMNNVVYSKIAPYCSEKKPSIEIPKESRFISDRTCDANSIKFIIKNCLEGFTFSQKGRISTTLKSDVTVEQQKVNLSFLQLPFQVVMLFEDQAMFQSASEVCSQVAAEVVWAICKKMGVEVTFDVTDLQGIKKKNLSDCLKEAHKKFIESRKKDDKAKRGGKRKGENGLEALSASAQEIQNFWGILRPIFDESKGVDGEKAKNDKIIELIIEKLLAPDKMTMSQTSLPFDAREVSIQLECITEQLDPLSQIKSKEKASYRVTFSAIVGGVQETELTFSSGIVLNRGSKSIKDDALEALQEALSRRQGQTFTDVTITKIVEITPQGTFQKALALLKQLEGHEEELADALVGDLISVDTIQAAKDLCRILCEPYWISFYCFEIKENDTSLGQCYNEIAQLAYNVRQRLQIAFVKQLVNRYNLPVKNVDNNKIHFVEFMDALELTGGKDKNAGDVFNAIYQAHQKEKRSVKEGRQGGIQFWLYPQQHEAEEEEELD